MQRDNWGKWAMGFALGLILVAGVAMVISVNHRKAPVSIGGQVVFAHIADDDDSRRKGLSGSSPLGEKEGMLFIFDTASRWGMWMREMKYDLDIVWMDSEKRVVYIAKNVSPDTYPKAFLPDKDALYVLELPAGFVDKYNVSMGNVVGFSVR
jgi:uncharacterized membrane protein (UPF0127 family)